MPVDLAEGGEFDVLDGFPGSSFTGWATNEFGLVVAVHSLSEGIVVGVADGADRGRRADLG